MNKLDEAKFEDALDELRVAWYERKAALVELDAARDKFYAADELDAACAKYIAAFAEFKAALLKCEAACAKYSAASAEFKATQ